jgi:hypothetical protein
MRGFREGAYRNRLRSQAIEPVIELPIPFGVIRSGGKDRGDERGSARASARAGERV